MRDFRDWKAAEEKVRVATLRVVTPAEGAGPPSGQKQEPRSLSNLTQSFLVKTWKKMEWANLRNIDLPKTITLVRGKQPFLDAAG